MCVNPRQPNKMSVYIGFIDDLKICGLEEISGGEDVNVQSVFSYDSFPVRLKNL